MICFSLYPSFRDEETKKDVTQLASASIRKVELEPRSGTRSLWWFHSVIFKRLMLNDCAQPPERLYCGCTLLCFVAVALFLTGNCVV